MATAKDTNGGIQVKLLIAFIGIMTTLLFIASIVLITIGYMNPFGSVGLGILGGGCVAFFSAVLFLCASGIWIKNKYYGDATDYKEKLVGRSSEDITLLKPASHMFPSEHSETGWEKNDQGDDNNPIPLYSVSTVYSSVSSSSPTSPQKLMPYNWQEEDLAGIQDCDVFSSSLTALQHGDMKLQQRLELTKSPKEPLTGGYNGQKVKDEQKRPHANKADLNFEKYVSGLPRQRQPLVMDSPCYVPRGNGRKQVENIFTDVQRTKDTHSSTNKDLKDINTQDYPVDASKTTTVSPQHNDRKGNHKLEKDQEKGKRIMNNIKQNTQAAHRQESSITESDPIIQNTKTKNQGIVRKDLITMLAENLEKKHNSYEKTRKCNQERTVIPSQALSPQTKLDNLGNVQISGHATRAEVPKGKVGITRNQIEPGRTNH